MFEDPLTNKIAGFLNGIGLEVVPRPIPGQTFLSGIYIENGKLLVDETVLSFPGDLLHEAGHLAVAPPKIRARMSDEVELPGFNMDAIEVGAIAWSYAAALHLGIDPAIVFHKNGYKGKAERLLENFSMGIYLGANVLEEVGMTNTSRPGEFRETRSYPHMIKWLRD